MSSSNFYLPLTGKEGKERLEGKYKRLFESEDEDEKDYSSRYKSNGKISQWKIADERSSRTKSQWLHSPSKKNSSNYQSQKTRPKITPQCPKKVMTASSKLKDSTAISSSALDNTRHGSSRKKLDKKKLKLHDLHYSSDEDEAMCDSDNGSSQEEIEEGVEIETTIKSAFEKGREGFSSMDTERPKLSVPPSAAKIDFHLSGDGEEPVVKVPACINQYLRDYQRDGIRFLYQHYIQGKGAILGDDMGLGKTIQVIGFLSALLGKQGNHRDTIRALPKFIRQLSDEDDEVMDSPPRLTSKPFLIIGPSAVMYNWLEQINTWGYFTTSKFHGADKEICLADVKKHKIEIVITTFETFRDNVDRLCEIEWAAVIVDEVHKIKGPKAQISKALGMVSTPHRYGLTGTALQNDIIDLWSILDWAQPGALGPMEKFDCKFVNAIQKGQRHDASKRDLALARKMKDRFAKIRVKIMLRRTKALIADQLPSKEDSVVMCRLAELQVLVYKAILNHPHMALILKAEDPCDCGKKKMKASCCYKYTKTASGKTKTWSLVLSYMHLLLKAANHCALLIPDPNGKTSNLQAKRVEEICQHALGDFPQFLEQTRDAAFLTLSDPKYCGKMKILQGLLSVFASAHDKVLVFSYSTRLLDVIEHYIIGQCYKYRRIDGKTSSLKRLEIVNQFNKDKDIFLCLISTKAGGLGLNLTGANRVVIFDPNWNPSHDLQAQDRAYRIGQTRDVKVYRLVSAGTIEENIYLRQIYKQQLDEVAVSTSNAKRYFHGIQGDRWKRGELFGVKNMFSLRTSDICLTMDILKRNERLEKNLSGYDITRYIPPSLESENVCDSTSGSDKEVDNDDDDDDNSSEDEFREENKCDDGDGEEEFLRTFFGEDKSDNLGASTSRPSALPLKRSLRFKKNATSPSSKQSDKNDDSSEDDEEDFFIPKLHRKSKDKKRGATCPEDKSPNGDMFTVGEITFSKSAVHSIVTQQREDNSSDRENNENQRKQQSGLSWLFLGSENENDDDDNDDTTNNKTYDDGIRRRSPKEFLKHNRKSPALSTLFPDSDEDLSDKDSHFDQLDEEDKEESRQTVEDMSKPKIDVKSRSKRGAAKITKKGEKPSGSGVKEPKAGINKSEFDSIKAVFEECGVLHIHGNKEVIGSSRAEDHMSRCAMQEVFEEKTNSQLPAIQCEPLPQSNVSEEEPKSKKRKGRKDPPDHNKATSTKVGSVKILLGQTPPALQRQVWNELCQFKGEDQLNLAQRLASCEAEERLAMLKEFYTHKHPQLADTLSSLLKIKSSDDLNTFTDKKTGQSQKKKYDPCATRKSRTISTSTERGHLRNTDKSSRPPSKSKIKRRPLPPTLTGQTLLDSESQDSLTAINPPMDPSPSPDNNNSQAYSPAPPNRKSKMLSPSGSKSRSSNRVRQKALNAIARTKLFNKPSDRTGVTYSDNGDEGLEHDDHLPSISCEKNDETVGDDRLDFTLTNFKMDEDIPSLLFEMGRKTSIRGKRGSCKAVSESKGKRSSNIESKKETYSDSSTIICDNYTMSSYPDIDSKGSKASKDKKQNKMRRNYASVLDNIFEKTIDVSPEDMDEEINPVNIDTNEQQDSPRKKSSSSSNKKSSTSTNTNLTHENKIFTPPHNEGINIMQSVDIIDDDEFDGLFTTSTLKEESPKSSRRKRPDLNPVENKNFQGRERIALQKDNNCYGQPIDLEDNSQSLFS